MKDAKQKKTERAVIGLAADTITSVQICLCAVNVIVGNNMSIKGAMAGLLEALCESPEEVIQFARARVGSLGERGCILIRWASSNHTKSNTFSHMLVWFGLTFLQKH